MPDPQGYPLFALTNLQNNVVFQIWSDGSIISNTGVEIVSGNGSPEGVKTAPVGSLYLQADGVAPNQLWQKQTGSGNTGWVNIGGGGGGGTPAGPNKAVQFNNAGAFDGDGGVTIADGTLTISPLGVLAITAALSVTGDSVPNDILDLFANDGTQILAVDSNGSVAIGRPIADNFALLVQAFLGGTSDVFVISDKNAAQVLNFSSNGGLTIHPRAQAGPPTDSAVVLTLIGTNVQDIQDWKDSGGTLLSSVDAVGKFIMPHIKVTALQVFANNAAAITGGLAAGDFYRTGADPDHVCVVH